MKLRLVMADPAGNRTALVETPVPPALWGEAARKIMAIPALGAEQVGYCRPPRGDALGRLEMMGGEFCGNASRSFGLLLAVKHKLGRSRVPIEVSGCPRPLAVEADPGEGTASCPIPVPLAIEELEVPGLGVLPAVRMEGITHIIAPGVPAGEEAFEAIRRAACARWDWEALGGMFLGGGHTLTPVVAVRATGSTVFESSCASGSAATAAWLSRREPDGVREYRLRQPGGVVTVRALRAGGALGELTVSGKVTLENPVEVEV